MDSSKCTCMYDQTAVNRGSFWTSIVWPYRTEEVPQYIWWYGWSSKCGLFCGEAWPAFGGCSRAVTEISWFWAPPPQKNHGLVCVEIEVFVNCFGRCYSEQQFRGLFCSTKCFRPQHWLGWCWLGTQWRILRWWRVWTGQNAWKFLRILAIAQSLATKKTGLMT